MADLKFKVNSGEGSYTSTAKTAQLVTAPTNQRVIFRGFRVTGKGLTNTDSPVKVEILTYASVTGGTVGTVVTSKIDGDLGETIQSTIAGNYSAEPTYTTAVVVDTFDVHPQTGYAEYFPENYLMKIKGGTGMALRVTTVQAETLTVTGFYEE